MVLVGRSATTATTTRISDHRWSIIKDNLGLSEHTRADFEKLIADYLKAIDVS